MCEFLREVITGFLEKGGRCVVVGCFAFSHELLFMAETGVVFAV